MNTTRHAVVALLIVGLVALVATAQADLRPLMGGGTGHGYQSRSHQMQPWHGYVIDRSHGRITTRHDGQRVRLEVLRGRVWLRQGDRFRILPIRTRGWEIIAELRHEGDWLATVRYTLGSRRGHSTRSFYNTPMPGQRHSGRGSHNRPSYNHGARDSHNPPAIGRRDDRRPRTETRLPGGRDGRGPGQGQGRSHGQRRGGGHR